MQDGEPGSLGVAIRLLFAMACDPFGRVTARSPFAWGSQYRSRRAFTSKAAEGEAQSSVRLRHHLPPLL